MQRFRESNGWGKITSLLMSSLLLSLLTHGSLHAETKTPTTPQTSQIRPQAPVNDEEEAADSEDEETPTPQAIQEVEKNTNPLNPAGTSLDKLIELQINDDLWKSMLGKLPCLEANDQCMATLQNAAIANSKMLKAMDERIEVIDQKIAEATKNNQKTIALGVFEPLVQSYLRIDEIQTPGQPVQRRGFFDKLADIFIKPLSSANEILSLIGLPLFRNSTGGDIAAQQRSIAIGDLSVKLAELKNKRAEVADKLREQVILSVLDFDQVRRDFQITQEIVKRESTRMKLLEVAYRFGQGDTDGFMARQTQFDQKKADTYRQWARMRSQMARIKLIVLGANEE